MRSWYLASPDSYVVNTNTNNSFLASASMMKSSDTTNKLKDGVYKPSQNPSPPHNHNHHHRNDYQKYDPSKDGIYKPSQTLPPPHDHNHHRCTDYQKYDHSYYAHYDKYHTHHHPYRNEHDNQYCDQSRYSNNKYQYDKSSNLSSNPITYWANMDIRSKSKYQGNNRRFIKSQMKYFLGPDYVEGGKNYTKYDGLGHKASLLIQYCPKI